MGRTRGTSRPRGSTARSRGSTATVGVDRASKPVTKPGGTRSVTNKRISARKPKKTTTLALSEPPLKLAAFNFQIFGTTKCKKAWVLEIVAQIIRRYDIILIQEIRDSSGKVVDKLFECVNKGLNPPDNYDYMISSRTGRSYSKEQYAFFYKPSTVCIVDSFEFDDGVDDGSDLFEREPLVVRLHCKYAAIQDFAVIGIHTSPEDAVKEISGLYNVYQKTKERWNIENIIICGDFNADGSYVSQRDWNSIPLKTDKRFQWLIDDSEDTTVTYSDASYDRFVVAGPSLQQTVVPKSAKVYRFDKDYNMPQSKAKEVSDHYPIEMQIKGKYNTKVQRKLKTYSSYVVSSKIKIGKGDNIRRIFTSSTSRSARAYFKVDLLKNSNGKSEYGILSKSNVKDPARCLRDLRSKLPEVVNDELILGVEAYQKSNALESLPYVYGLEQKPKSSYEVLIRCHLKSCISEIAITKKTK